MSGYWQVQEAKQRFSEVVRSARWTGRGPYILLPETAIYSERGGMTKRLVDVADEDLEAAREALQTHTIRETVTAALRLAAAQAARRREIERLTSGALPDLGEPDVRDAAWRP